MDSTPFLAKIDDTPITVNISKDTISAKTQEGKSVFNIAICDITCINKSANIVIINWNAGNVLSSISVTSRHAREIITKIKENI